MEFKKAVFYSNDAPPRGTPLLAKCPGWCASGYQVCFWGGKSFFYDEQPNDMFNEEVIAWSAIKES